MSDGVVTATLHKVTAGDGYEYFTRQVAAHDSSERGHSALADYYSARGETPGTWLGSGLPGLTVTYRDRSVDPEQQPEAPATDNEVKKHPAPPLDPDRDRYPVREVDASRVNAGDIVTEEQMHALFGLGMHPQAAAITGEIVALEVALGATRANAERAAAKASRLGRPFQVHNADNPFRQQCARAFSEYNTAHGLAATDPLPEEVRARIRTAVARGMFRYELGRDPFNERELSGWVARNSRQRTTAVAGYGWCFSPPKSVSVLWALAPRQVSEVIEQAQRAAVQDAIDYLEANATYTRLGRHGVRQVDAEGLIATSFEHRDSRSGDPDFHTHIVVANRVRAIEDGQWRTLDGTMFYKSVVTASEIYNTRLEHHLETKLGLGFAPRPGTDPSKRPIREIIGLDLALIEYFSRRDARITARLGELTVRFQRELGRDPTTREMYGLMQRATLETRPRKHAPRSLAEQRATWLEQAIEVLGSLEAVTAMVTRVLEPIRVSRPHIDERWITAQADQVLATIAGERSVWQATHVRSEAERVIRGRVPPPDWARVVDALVAEALAPTRSVARGDPDRRAEPALRTPPQALRRANGMSVFTTAGSQLYTSVETLSTEAQLISMITESRGRAVPTPVVEAAIAAYNLHPDHRDRQLNEGQEAVVRAFATSGRGIQITDAPAGTGKTTAMMVLASAWLASGGRVCGLAPTAKAAGELSAEISAPVNTVDKLLHVIDSHTPTLESVIFDSDAPPPPLPQWILDIDDTTLVIIDEHVQIPDLSRLRILIFLLDRGATVRLLGDQWQLQAIDAGGAARDMIHVAGLDALTLTHVVRFNEKAEATASLAVREGDPAGLGFYLDRDRIHVGSPASVVDGAFHAWIADHTGGRESIMLAATHVVVDELNTLARDYRLSGLENPGPEVELANDQRASVGDTIRTTLNDRRLPVGEDDFVRNGYQWTVTAVHPDGSITAVRQLPRRRHGESVYLPADYVVAHTRLGYAATIGSVQGVTVDTSHTVLTGTENRYQLYVALTRGRLANHLYVTTALDGTPEESFWTERAVLPRTATDILVAILGRTETTASAHTELREALDPLQRMGRAVDVYLESLGVATVQALGPDAMARLDADAEALLPTLTSGAGWPVLRQNLATLALSGRNPISALRAAATGRELSTAHNIAAVLDWRLDTTGHHSSTPGPLPWLPGIPAGLAEHPEFGDYLAAHARIVTDLAHKLRDTAAGFTVSTAPVWARPLVGSAPELLADLLVWRAATRVASQDLRPAGPARHTVAEHRYHHRLALLANEAIGDANLAATHWAAVVKELDERITDDPFWPILAERLDTAHRAGIDVTALLTEAAGRRPLPDDMPAAALWSRLDLDPGALSSTSGPDGGLRPPWTPDVVAALGEETAARILADPAWTSVVAAVEHALTTTAADDGHDTEQRPWTALELLTLAGDLLLDGRGSDRDRLRPDQLATALAWRIDAIAHHRPTYSPDDSDEPPPDPAFEPEEDPVPEDVAEFLTTAAEHTMAEPTNATGDSDTDPTATDDEPDTRDTGQNNEYAAIAAQIREVATRFAAGNPDQAYELLTALPLTESDRSIIRRVAKTLRQYAFPVAKARLLHAATVDDSLKPIIVACIPDTDPGLYRREQGPRWEPPRDNQRRRDRTQIRDRDEQRQRGRAATDRHRQILGTDHDDTIRPAGIDRTFVLDDVIHPAGDERTHRDPVYGSGEGPDYTDTSARNFPCVACELDLPVQDRARFNPNTRRMDHPDGLCSDCREQGEPGIPPHDPAHYLEARCAFITETRTPAAAIALLRRDFHRAPLSARLIIRQWVEDHDLSARAEADSHPAVADEPASPVEPTPQQLTDAELAREIIELTQHIASLRAIDAAVSAPSQPPTQEQRNNDIAAIDAINHARATTAEVDAITARVRDVSGQMAAARTERVGARRKQQKDIDATLTALRTTKQALLVELDRARGEQHGARRHAEFFAGPADQWDAILAKPSIRPDAVPAPQSRTVQPATDLSALTEQLTLLHTEQDRRRDLDIRDVPTRPTVRTDQPALDTDPTPRQQPDPTIDYGIDL
ncbi:relaxase domain-containing protein (plasmid) [Nocardia sp. NBC_01377]|uniref:MobF family relaxase n=1 Tax=Nocardia sp. NBC_01377 TaxID=2903595 RepID=UPI00324DFA91